MAAPRPLTGSQSEPSGDLAFLALRAAIQLGRELKEKEADQQPIKALVEAIRQTPGIESALDRRRMAANPKAVSLISGAFLDVRKESMNTRQILERISAIVEGLDSQDRNKRRESRQELHDFCLALHSRLLADKFPTKEADTIFGGGLRRLELR